MVGGSGINVKCLVADLGEDLANQQHFGLCSGH